MNQVHLLSFRFLLLRHGYLLVFFYILAVAFGVPLPADPLMLVMGAMVGNRGYYFFPVLLCAVVAALIGDSVWYGLGRFKGHSVLAFLCKLSLEPDTCVRKTESTFAKRGAGALVLAKFVPGMSLVSVALAGVSRLSYWRFLLADAAGSMLWAAAYLIVGRIFYRQVDSVVSAVGLFGRRAGLIVVTLLVIYILMKYLQRWRFMRTLRTNRVTPEEAQALLQGGDPITIVDLRHLAEIERDGIKIAGARILRPDELRSRSHEIPEDQQIILYCT
ncbi:MAG: VTT domain-containing protein [Bryobacteraceae bacterium]